MRKYQISIALTLSGVILLGIFTFFSWWVTQEVENQRETEMSKDPGSFSSVQKRDLSRQSLSMLESYRKARDEFLQALQELVSLEKLKVSDDKRRISHPRRNHFESKMDLGRRKRFVNSKNHTSIGVTDQMSPIKHIDIQGKKGVVASWNSSVEDDIKPFIIQLKYEWSNATSGAPVSLFIPAVPKVADFTSDNLDKLQRKLNHIITEMTVNSSSKVNPLIAILDDQHNDAVWLLSGWFFLGILILTIAFTATARVKVPKRRGSHYKVLQQYHDHKHWVKESLDHIEIDSRQSSSFSLVSLRSLIDEY